jgi:acetyl-CoA carboxylase carboxyl transferase subunit alpha
MEYLEFELPIKELEEKYQQTITLGEESDVDVSATIKQIEKPVKIYTLI